MDQSNLVGDSLALVNVVRSAYGFDSITDLPVSDARVSSNCLFARALRDVGCETVSGDGTMKFASERIAASVATLWGTQNDGSFVKAPAPVGQLIAKFDLGGLPGHTRQ